MAEKVNRNKIRNYYREVEAMYRRGRSCYDISLSTGLSRLKVMDICQKIYAMDIRAMRVW